MYIYSYARNINTYIQTDSIYRLSLETFPGNVTLFTYTYSSPLPYKTHLHEMHKCTHVHICIRVCIQSYSRYHRSISVCICYPAQRERSVMSRLYIE